MKKYLKKALYIGLSVLSLSFAVCAANSCALAASSSYEENVPNSNLPPNNMTEGEE